MLPASYATMTTATTLANNAVVPYGLGLDVKKISGHPAASHGGAVTGFLSFVLHLSDQDIAVAVIVNAFPAPTDGNSELIAITVANAALGSL